MSDLELYQQAKEAYYNGTPIMEDFEFDELEKKLGLENKAYIGAKKNPSYTVKHPFIMGSLSKVQVKEEDDGQIRLGKYVEDINKYLCRYHKDNISIIVTPKYDGCSFEAQVRDGKIVSISSRGDGEYGKDIKQHIISKVLPNVDALNFSDYVLRGEVLINKQLFKDKYSDFVNPRSFVSGILNRDYCDESDFQEAITDLSIVIYELRVPDGKGAWNDLDWNHYVYPDAPKKWYTVHGALTAKEFEELYKDFDSYRTDICEFALDGIVFKPTADYRESNTTEIRPKDCVAVKFAPQLKETSITDIKWQLSNKTGEYTPVIIVEPVIMDGKEVTRASAHNYGYVIEKKIGIGTKVILSLAGDIIPFIYKITNTDAFDESKIGIDTLPEYYIEGVHLFKKLTIDEQIKAKFLASAEALKIPCIGKSAAETIYKMLLIRVDNILKVTPAQIKFSLGGKIGENCAESFMEFAGRLTIKDIIQSCAFPLCGEKAAEQIECEYLNKGDGDWTGLPKQAYEWIFNEDTEEYKTVKNLVNQYININAARKNHLSRKQQKSEQIPIIMTGEPNDYSTKAEFLKAHPEYRETTSWKEVKILFTNSLESNSGKMKKAREKNVEIKLY